MIEIHVIELSLRQSTFRGFCQPAETYQMQRLISSVVVNEAARQRWVYLEKVLILKNIDIGYVGDETVCWL